MMKLSSFVLLAALFAQSSDARLLGRGGNFFKMFGKNKKGNRQGGGGNGGGGNGAGGNGAGGNGAGNRGGGFGGRGGGGGYGGNCVIDKSLVGDLGDSATAELKFMREEEKMARDVYLTLLTEYGTSTTPVFRNIANSEQKHMDNMLAMIDLYDIEDPVKSDSMGVFTDETLGQMYTDLTTQGKLTLVDALLVGALIEETDIVDLREAIDITGEETLACVYNNLLKASYNHLNAFVRAVRAQGGTYTPTLLDEKDAASILGE